MLWVMASRKGFRVRCYNWCDAYTFSTCTRTFYPKVDFHPGSFYVPLVSGSYVPENPLTTFSVSCVGVSFPSVSTRSKPISSFVAVARDAFTSSSLARAVITWETVSQGQPSWLKNLVVIRQANLSFCIRKCAITKFRW